MNGASSVLLGQAISLELAVLSLLTKLIADWCAYPLPGLQNLLGNLALFAVSRYRLKHGQMFALDKRSMLSLLFISTLDTTGAFLTNWSFHFNISLVSMTLLGSFTIPCVMVLSFLGLGVRYGVSHLLGIALAICGMLCVLQADGSLMPTQAFTPDSLVLLAAVLYSVSNLLSQVFLAGEMDVALYLSWLSLFGLLVSMWQVWWNGEIGSLAMGIPWPVWLVLVVHTAAFVLCFWTIALYFTRHDAVGLNLNLLTSGLFGMGFASSMFHERIVWMKLLGYLLLVLGIGWYSKYPVLTKKTDYESIIV
ncbi:hypothetical protein BASA81_009837 [Batrachochytrium salamandrivorans]|nr:hypothetical protein BASA81_009837 [Batrachochytrium salamandrivorans]